MFISNPNLPTKRVGLLVIDERASDSIKHELAQREITYILNPAHKRLSATVCSHPDMVIHHLGGNKLIIAPEIEKNFSEELKKYGFELILGSTKLGNLYPMDVAYNVARIGNYAFLNIKNSDKTLIEHLNILGVERINIKQGYSKCCISIVDEKSIITSDVGIAKKAIKYGFDVLLLEPEKTISLPGVNFGFIGGCSFMMDSNTYALTGDINKLKQATIIKNFLFKKNIDIVSLSKDFPIDLGSLLPLKYQ